MKDVSPNFRMGFVETEALGFGPGQYIRRNETVTVRPGKSVKAMESELAHQYGTKVRIRIWDR